ncbi:MAG: hypothetical protein JSV88_20655 [Candidatus Aminicenantes bacterium]|nr:MAG: hypothetical protein JSV88_20655 [Candidatus Aminicenantes bacterium]
MKKTKVMVFCTCFLIACAIPSGLHSAIKLTDQFSVYGFIKLDAHYQDSGMNSILAPRYAKPGEGNLALTAMNTRFGFKWEGAKICRGWKIGAQLEWDLFDGASANQMKFRTRHANFTLTNGGSTFLFGQFWDLFAPLGPTTLMTNGYLWQVGNVGFRRAQMRYTYSSDKFSFGASINDPTSAGARATKMPIVESRLGVTLVPGKTIGVSAAYGKERNGAGTPLQTDVTIMGVCLDWNLSFPTITLKGEFATGENLRNFLSRAHVWEDTINGQFDGKKVNSFWGQIVYGKKCTLWVGYAFEKFTDTSQLSALDLKDTYCMFAGIKCVLCDGVSFGLEYAHFISKYYMGPPDDKTNQFIGSFIYSF